VAAGDHLGLQFEYDTPELGESKTVHRVQAFAGPTATHVGQIIWSSKEIRNVIVSSDQQRRGVATRMFDHAQGLAASNPRIPAPKHSKDRTDAGDAWARQVGGRLPRRRQVAD
jgi:hypothetical protein